MIDRFECFCGAGWFTKEELIEHAKKEHPELKELNVCQVCDTAFKDYNEAKDHVLQEHDVYCDECQDHYIYDAYNLVWWFTVEKDIGIAARSEEEAEKKFRNKYGDKTILGIIRPTSFGSDSKRTCDESCDHCNPETAKCEKHGVSIEPYQTCIEVSQVKHRRRIK